MPITARTATGTTLTFSGGFTAKVINVEPFAQNLGAIDANNMESGDYMQKIPEDLIDLGDLSFEIEYEPDATPPVLGDVQTCTIDPKGLGAGSLIVGTGFFTKFEATLPVNGKMTAQVAFTWDGDECELGAS